MKKALVAFGFLIFLFPSVSSAASITYQQASSIIVLLEAFGVNQATINTVWADIQPADTPLSPPTVATTQDTGPNYQTPIGGVIPTSTSPVLGGITPIMNDVTNIPVACDDTPVFSISGTDVDTSTDPIQTSGGSIGVSVSSACTDAQWILTLASPRTRNMADTNITRGVQTSGYFIAPSGAKAPNWKYVYGQGEFQIYDTNPAANIINGVNSNNGQYIITATDAVHGGTGSMTLNIGTTTQQ